jgi:hypothetical protein
VATGAANAANANTASLITAERAYVKLSILVPGVQWRANTGNFHVEAQAKNFGRTPATVTDTRIGKKICEHGDALPQDPPYQSREGQAKHTGFLVQDDHFTFEKNFGGFIKNQSNQKLWIYGYVDYITFGKRYRFGFARVYRPGLREDIINLLPDTEAGPYDYDRERNRDEGVDWDHESVP